MIELLAFGVFLAVGAFVAMTHGDGSMLEDLSDGNAVAPLNMAAFLGVIRAGESSNNYRALVGGGNFSSYATHPYFGEGFRGLRVSGGRVSYAAGAYQITRDTFVSLAYLNLPDFSPHSQDQMARALIERRGATSAIYAGQWDVAAQLLRNEWEMFVQPRWQGEAVKIAFEERGGISA